MTQPIVTQQQLDQLIANNPQLRQTLETIQSMTNYEMYEEFNRFKATFRNNQARPMDHGLAGMMIAEIHRRGHPAIRDQSESTENPDDLVVLIGGW